MESKLLFEQSLVDTLREHCDNAQKRIWVASPFIGNEDQVLRILGNKWKSSALDCRILTDVEAGFMGEDVFEQFIKVGASVRSLVSLHAKIYIVDDWCLITSANLTGAAFSMRYEIGIACQDHLKEVETRFVAWWDKAHPVQILSQHIESTIRDFEIQGNPKFSKISKLPDLPTTSNPIESKTLHTLIDWYVETWEKYHYYAIESWKPNTIENTYEGYKWKAFRQAQLDFRDGMPEMNVLLAENSSLNLAGNLLAGPMYYPRRMLRKLSSAYPDSVRSCFDDLFDENVLLKTRIIRFLDSMLALTETAKNENPSLFNADNPSSMQSIRSISVYLALRYPEKYYLYKSGVYEDFLKYAEIEKVDLGFRKEDKLQKYFFFCNRLRSELQKNSLLMSKCTDTFGNNKYNLSLMVQDFMYCVSVYYPEYLK